MAQRAHTTMISMALGGISGCCCWLLIWHAPALVTVVGYAPGAILGMFLFIRGQLLLGWRGWHPARLCTLIAAGAVAWRLAGLVQSLGGPLPWLGASLTGALGLCAGMLLSWPLRRERSALLAGMTAAGVAGGVLFTLASQLQWYRGAQRPFSLLLLCLWQAGSLTAAGLCLQGTARTALQANEIPQPMPTTSLWIDTDNALGADRGDVDDGLALAALLSAARSQRVRIAGISVVSGNTDAITSARCTQRLLEAAAAHVPLVPMADAAQAIARLPPGTSLLALGPLTNIAAALRLNPECSKHLELRMVAAVRHAWRHPVLVLSDLNQRTDPPAARLARSSRWQRLRILPLDVIRRLRINGEALDRLAQTSPLGAYLCLHCQRWLARTAWRYPLLRSFPAWDLVAALDALGVLPNSQFDAATRMLTDFDAPAALQVFHDLICGTAHGTA